MSSTIMLEKTIETLYQREFSDFHYITSDSKKTVGIHSSDSVLRIVTVFLNQTVET